MHAQVYKATALAALLLGACTSDDKSQDDTGSKTDDTGEDVSECAGEPVVIEIGTGLSSYTPLAENDPVRIVYGAQGGWHIDFAWRADHIGQLVRAKGMVWVKSDQTQMAGGSDLDAVNVSLVNYEDCSGESWAFRVLLDEEVVTPDLICGLQDVPLDVRIEVEDVDGLAGSADLVVTAKLDGSNQQVCPTQE